MKGLVRTRCIAAALVLALSSTIPARAADSPSGGAVAVCGNGVVESGETCDDGNSRDESDPGVPVNPLDTCPKNCRTGSCSSSGTPKTAAVTLTLPEGTAGVGGLTVFLDYPDQLVSIPGTGSNIGDRIGGLQAGTLGAPNDLDYGLLEVLASSSSVAPGRIFTVTFDTCQGTPPVQATDFRCLVKDASDSMGLAVAGAGCTVSLP